MELKVFWRTLRRRWYLTIVVVALTIGTTIYIVGSVGPAYEAEGSALVFPPASSTPSADGETEAVGNPYLELAGVTQARDVVIRTLKSRTVQTSWADDFPGMSYEATPDFTNSAPIILFTVEGDTAVGAAAALDDLMGRVPTILADLQGGLGLDDDGYVTARKLTQDARPAIVRKTQIRAGLLAAAVAGGLGLLLLALIDSLLGVRVRARTKGEAARVVARTSPARDDDSGEWLEETGSVEVQELEAADHPAPVEQVHAYRAGGDSEVTVSPARSTWAHTLNGPQVRDRGPRSPGRTTKPRTRATGRNS